jgi:hypothetical protein
MSAHEQETATDTAQHQTLALLPASPATKLQWDIDTWKVLGGDERGIVLGADAAGHVRWSLRIEGQSESATLRIRSLDDDTTATLSAAGEVLQPASVTTTALATALFEDARQPVRFDVAASDDEHVGLTVEALSGVRDSGEVHYAGSGCSAQTSVLWSSLGFDARTTVASPYLFAGCWVQVNLTLYLESGEAETQSYRAMACAVWDPSCPSRNAAPPFVSNASGPISDMEIGYYAPGNGTSRF